MLSNDMFMSSEEEDSSSSVDFDSIMLSNTSTTKPIYFTVPFFQCPGVMITFPFPITEYMPASVHENELNLRCTLRCATFHT
jgi:hypothetical protein